MSLLKLKKGTIVRCISGHDKGNYFVITGIDTDGRVQIADGHRRRLEKPKVKNQKHIALTNSSVRESDYAVLTNKLLRKILHPYNFMNEEGSKKIAEESEKLV